MGDELPVVDLADPVFWADPYAALAAARARSPVAAMAGGGLMAVSYDAVEAVLRDPRFGTTDLLARTGIRDGPVREWWSQVMFSHDPPEHTRLRTLVGRAFTPRRADALRPVVTQLCDELVSSLDPDADPNADGTVDFVEVFAHELPIRVMAHLLAIPDDDLAVFAGWTAALGDVFATVMTPELRSQLERTVVDLGEYVRSLVDRRRSAPGPDLLSELISAEEAGDRLSTSELVAMVQNLLFAGHDTTRSMLMAGMALLASHTDQMAALAEDPTLAAAATEEILRYEPSTLGGGRTALTDVDVCGVVVPAGTAVATSSLGANRDPAVYDDPDRFDIGRSGPRHMSFGSGIHHCLGAALARMEGQVAFPMLAQRCGHLRLAEEPAWVPYAAVRRFERLLLRKDTP